MLVETLSVAPVAALIADPLGLEGESRTVDGLGLLEVDTVMAPEKTVRNSRALSLEFDADLSGYEIHLGVTKGPDCARAAVMIEGRPDGARSRDGRVMGSYLHGLFSSDSYRGKLLESFGISGGGGDYRQSVEMALDELAEELGARLAPEWLRQWLG